MEHPENRYAHAPIRRPFAILLKGMAMGIAEVIPGVSGGTIALITGIYERLLRAIKSVDLQCLRLVFGGRIRTAWVSLDRIFLLLLLAGMAAGLVSGVFGVSHLMEHYPEILWAFFFGLIAASAWYIGRQVALWNAGGVVIFLIGVVVAFVITRISPAEGSTHLLYVGLSGFLAISALMLPGISGSFILLLLGMYPIIIGSVRSVLTGQGGDKIILLICFAAGILLGLITFSRVLTWMFRHYHATTLAMLAGFMIGSLGKIWPWRVPLRWVDSDGNVLTAGTPGAEARVLAERMVMPGDYPGDAHMLAVVLALTAGVGIVLLTVYIESKQPKTSR